ncbi:MAG: Uma2 family endonuclease [Bacteroidota bacterium]
MENSLIEELGLQEEYKLVANKDNKLVYAHTTYVEIDEPNYEQFETENDDPVDNLFSEMQQRLFIDPLHNNDWTDRDFWASANVGIYYAINKPPVIPDMFLSLDVRKPEKWVEKKDKCYFSWVVGKLPELVVEVVSNKVGNENEQKMQLYAQLGIQYYIIFDPYNHLYPDYLNVFILKERQYERLESDNFFMPEVRLGIMIWNGLFEGEKAPWARWCTKEGQVLYTGGERADEAESKAEQSQKELELLREKLKKLGLNPEEL